MKKILLVGGIVVAILVIGVVIFLGYLGMFTTVLPQEKMMGPYTFVYEDFVGPYQDTGAVFERVQKALEAAGMHPAKGLGIYFDDPSQVPKEKLRSRCGSLIEGTDLELLEKVKDNFKVDIIGQSNSIVVTFPIRNMVSYMMGPAKCYPVLQKFAAKKGYQVLNRSCELYDMPAKVIYYMFTIKP